MFEVTLWFSIETKSFVYTERHVNRTAVGKFYIGEANTRHRRNDHYSTFCSKATNHVSTLWNISRRRDVTFCFLRHMQIYMYILHMQIYISFTCHIMQLKAKELPNPWTRKKCQRIERLAWPTNFSWKAIIKALCHSLIRNIFVLS